MIYIIPNAEINCLTSSSLNAFVC